MLVAWTMTRFNSVTFIRIKKKKMKALLVIIIILKVLFKLLIEIKYYCRIL
jgi:hypothetical protein